MPVAGVTAVPARRVVLGVAQVSVQLALLGAVQHRLGQPTQQPALPGQLQAFRAGPLGKLTDQLLIGRACSAIGRSGRRLRSTP
jgi:hypothetical protein